MKLFWFILLLSVVTATKTCKTKPYRVGITAHDFKTQTWAIIHHILFMYQTIEKTTNWEPYLLLHQNITSYKTVRNYTYRSINRHQCGILNTIITGSYAWEYNEIKKYCPDTHIIRFVQGPTYIDGIQGFINNKTGVTSISMDFKSDTVWYTPQYKWSESYLKYINNAAAAYEAPYVWAPDVYLSRSNVSFTYKNGTANNVGVYETNRGIYKMSIIPMIIVEEAYKKNGNITARANGLNELASYAFEKDFIPRLNIKWALYKKLANIPDTWHNNNIGTIVSHTWNNALNYLWLEALYSGMALVHNSDIMKDCGYYYKDFNISEGSEALIRAINTHGIKQQEKDKKCLWRYSIDNEKNIKWYERLLNYTL